MNLLGVRIIFGLWLLACSCARPQSDLWPPQPGAPAHAITVSVDSWHAVISFPDDSGPLIPHASRSHGLYEEWGYAERAWYLENRQGLSGILRVLFRFTPGVVEVGRHDKVWAERISPSEAFSFRLSEEGYRRLRRHLQESLASSTPILTTQEETYYPAVPDYNLIVNQCHQYAARALREAGLPVSVFWAVSRAGFVTQLEQAVEMQEAESPSP